MPPALSPELIDKLNKLATYLTEQGEFEACDLIDTVVERLTPPPGEKP
jgi:lipoprotein NlpI